MTARHSIWTALVALQLAAAPIPMLADPGKPPSSVLEGVPALEKPVSYSETKIPLGELVQRLAQDTGAKLSAARDVSDEPVAVVVKAMPARELLDQLAALLDYRWAREPEHRTPSTQHPTPAFVIDQDLASKQREAALRGAQLAAAQKRLREQLAAYVQVASLPDDQFTGLLSEAQKHDEELRKLTPEARQALMASPEEQERSRRYTVARNLWTGTNRALTHMLQALPSRQWQTLREEGWLTFSSNPRPGELQLPVEIEKTFRSSPTSQWRPDQAGIYNDPQFGERMRQQEQQFQETWAAATGYRVTMRLETDQYESKGALFLTANANPLRAGTPNPSPPFFGMGTRVFLYAGPEDQSQDQARQTEETSERAARLAQEAVVGVPRKLEITVKPRPKPFGTGAEPLCFRDLLPDLARTYGVQIISDAYWATSPRLDEPLSSGESVSLYALLDRLAGRTHHWEHVGNRITLRSRTWFFDRPREVPLRLVRHWKEIAEKQKMLPFDEYVRMATELTDAQIETLEDVGDQAGFPYGSFGCLDVQFVRHALRLYASLSPGQQQALWHGQPLPVGSMTAAQRSLFLIGLRENARRQFDPASLDLSHWTEGSFRLAPERLLRTIMDQGGSVYLEKAPAKDAASPTTARSRAASDRLPEEFGTPVKEPPMRVDKVRFDFEYAPDQRRSVDLTVAPINSVY